MSKREILKAWLRLYFRFELAIKKHRLTAREGAIFNIATPLFYLSICEFCLSWYSFSLVSFVEFGLFPTFTTRGGELAYWLIWHHDFEEPIPVHPRVSA